MPPGRLSVHYLWQVAGSDANLDNFQTKQSAAVFETVKCDTAIGVGHVVEPGIEGP